MFLRVGPDDLGVPDALRAAAGQAALARAARLGVGAAGGAPGAGAVQLLHEVPLLSTGGGGGRGRSVRKMKNIVMG